MPTTIKRAYSGKDADMLTAAAVILQSAINHQSVIVLKRPNWNGTFFTDLQTTVTNAFPNLLGVDNASELRKATALLNSIQVNAMSDLSLFKVQLEEDFKDNKPQRDEMLTNLGFTAHYRQVQKKSQSALVELLFKFKTNMTAPIQAQITTAGTAPELITSILGYAETLKNSNISQEALKGGRKETTKEVVEQLNAIYNQVISIARICTRIFKDQYPIRDQFSFAKVKAAISGGTHAANGGQGSPSGTSNPGTSGSGSSTNTESQTV